MVTNVLILCTHNSARNVPSEGMLNRWAQKFGKDVRAYSASSAPSSRLNPFALGALTNADIDTTGYRGKSWDEFVADGVPRIRVVITVYDSVAAEQCPYWPGSPVRVHWGYANPSNAPSDDEDKQQAFKVAYRAIGYHMLQLLALSLDTLSNAGLQVQLERIS